VLGNLLSNVYGTREKERGTEAPACWLLGKREDHNAWERTGEEKVGWVCPEDENSSTK